MDTQRGDTELLCFFTPRIFATHIDGWIPIAPCGKRFYEVAVPRDKQKAIRERGLELRDDLDFGPPESLRHQEWEKIVSQGSSHIKNEVQRKAQMSRDGPKLAAYLRRRFGRPVPWVEAGLLVYDIKSSGQGVQAKFCEYLICLSLLSFKPRGQAASRSRARISSDTTTILDTLERRIQDVTFQKDVGEHRHWISLLRHLLEFAGGPKNDHQRRGLDLDRSITEALHLYGRSIEIHGEGTSAKPASHQLQGLRASRDETKALALKLQREFYPIACPAPWDLYRSFSKRKVEGFQAFVATALYFLRLEELDDMTTASMAILFASKDHGARITVESWTRSPGCRAWFESAKVRIKDRWDPESPQVLDSPFMALALAAMIRCRRGWPQNGPDHASSVAARPDVEAFGAFLRCEPVPDEAALMARIIKSIHARVSQRSPRGYLAGLMEEYIDVPRLSTEEV